MAKSVIINIVNLNKMCFNERRTGAAMVLILSALAIILGLTMIVESAIFQS